MFEQKARVALAGAALAFDSGGTPPTSTAASFFVLLPPLHPMQGSDLPTLAYRRLLVGGLSQPRGRVERRTLWVNTPDNSLDRVTGGWIQSPPIFQSCKNA